MRTILALLFSLLLPIIEADAQPAERRVALVIGNGKYELFPGLPNPRNDAEDVTEALKRAGFEVIGGVNLTFAETREKMRQFARAAQGADAALAYYAGHGLQSRARNYIVPVDAKLQDEGDLDFETIQVDDIVATLGRAKGARILILDACRNLPLKEKSNVGPNTQTGLAKISGRGLVVAYATQANALAYDGPGRNSIFTEAFLKAMGESKLDLPAFFQRVSIAVDQRSGGRQTPEVSLSYPGQFFFNRSETELEAWRRVNSKDAASLRDFIRRFPKGEFVEWAQSGLERLEGSRPAPTVATGPSSGMEDFDRSRREQFDRFNEMQAERTRRRRQREADEERQRQDAEAERLAELKRKADDERLRQAELQRAEEDRRRQEAEAQRQAELKRKADDERQRQAELQRAEDERRRQEAEAQRQADLKRRADEAQRQAELQRVEDERRRQEAEAQRQAELKRRADEERQRQAELQKAEEGRRRQDAEVQRQAELKRRADEERLRQVELQRADEVRRRQAELQRADEERRRQEAEAQRQAELKRKADEERLRQAELQRAEDDRRRQAAEAQRQAVLKAEEERRQQEVEEERRLAEFRQAQNRLQTAIPSEGQARSDTQEGSPPPTPETPREGRFAALPAESTVRGLNQPEPNSSPSSAGPSEAAAVTPEPRDATPAKPDGSMQVAYNAQPLPEEKAAIDHHPSLAKGIDRDRLHEKIEVELHRIRCLKDPADHVWDDRSRRALERYARQAGLPAPPKDLNDRLLDRLEKIESVPFCPLDCGTGTRAEGDRCVAIEKPKPEAPVARKPKPEPRETVERPKPEAPVARRPKPEPREAARPRPVEPARAPREAVRPRPEPRREAVQPQPRITVAPRPVPAPTAAAPAPRPMKMIGGISGM